MAYILPIVIIVFSNIIYQICTKSVPQEMNTFASLTVTYIVAAAASLIMFFVTGKGSNLIQECAKTNWAPLVMGVILLGLEGGYIFAFKAGWTVSTAAIVQSSFMATGLIFVGYFLFKEPITWNKVVGIVICLIGLVFINKKSGRQN